MNVNTCDNFFFGNFVAFRFNVNFNKLNFHSFQPLPMCVWVELLADVSWFLTFSSIGKKKNFVFVCCAHLSICNNFLAHYGWVLFKNSSHAYSTLNGSIKCETPNGAFRFSHSHYLRLILNSIYSVLFKVLLLYSFLFDSFMYFISCIFRRFSPFRCVCVSNRKIDSWCILHINLKVVDFIYCFSVFVSLLLFFYIFQIILLLD